MPDPYNPKDYAPKTKTKSPGRRFLEYLYNQGDKAVDVATKTASDKAYELVKKLGPAISKSQAKKKATPRRRGTVGRMNVGDRKRY